MLHQSNVCGRSKCFGGNIFFVIPALVPFSIFFGLPAEEQIDVETGIFTIRVAIASVLLLYLQSTFHLYIIHVFLE